MLLHCLAMLLFFQAPGRIECFPVSTVHGPAPDRDATVKQRFLHSIIPTRSKHASLINMSSLYRFITFEQTGYLHERPPNEITKKSGMQKHLKNPNISNVVKR